MATDQRSAFAAEIGRIARTNKSGSRAEGTTKDGHRVLLTGLWNNEVGAITITAPDGIEVGRADGWKIGETAEVAAFLWDVMEKDRAQAAKRQRLAGLKAVTIAAANALAPASGSKASSSYHLTPEQLDELLKLAAQMAAANSAE